MNSTLKNVLAFVAGALLGGLLNSTIISNYGKVFPLPEGFNPNDFESIKENIHLLEIPHLASIFLAHALGTLLGAFIVSKFAASNQRKLALGIGVLFLIGGTMVAAALGFKPLGFSLIDIVFAYFPFALLGWKLAGSK